MREISPCRSGNPAFLKTGLLADWIAETFQFTRGVPEAKNTTLDLAVSAPCIADWRPMPSETTSRGPRVAGAGTEKFASKRGRATRLEDAELIAGKVVAVRSSL